MVYSSLKRWWVQLILGSFGSSRIHHGATGPPGVLHAILIVALCVLALYDSPELMSSSNFFQAQPQMSWGITGESQFACVSVCN